MKLSLWSIGKPNEVYVQKGVEDFTKRISNYFPVEWKIIPPPKNAGLLKEADLKKKEAEIVTSLLKQDDLLVCLDERGKQMSSDELATFVGQKANESAKQLVFLIGGAYGIESSLLVKAHLKWSLSHLTFPHQLVRLILAEQLYRACTILRNEKYHHGDGRK
jgi:23S rRNA (pseudouridine1915-N3)-methyltransferase